jgi:hypothetical protein
MAVTITSEDERASAQLDVEVARNAKRLVIADAEGSEYHFGCGIWTANGTFIHVATYTAAGREPYAWWNDVLDGIERGWEIRSEPELGPLISPLTEVALASLARLCNFHNGFYGEPEKKWAVEHLRALWEEAQDPLDPDEVAVWAATHGWAPKHAKTLREIAEGVRHGKQFRGAGQRAIRRDLAREGKMVAHWREQLSERA